MIAAALDRDTEAQTSVQVPALLGQPRPQAGPLAVERQARMRRWLDQRGDLEGIERDMVCASVAHAVGNLRDVTGEFAALLESVASARESRSQDYLGRLRSIHAGAVRGHFGRGRRVVLRHHRHLPAATVAATTSDDDLRTYIQGPGIVERLLEALAAVSGSCEIRKA